MAPSQERGHYSTSGMEKAPPAVAALTRQFRVNIRNSSQIRPGPAGAYLAPRGGLGAQLDDVTGRGRLARPLAGPLPLQGLDIFAAKKAAVPLWNRRFRETNRSLL